MNTTGPRAGITSLDADRHRTTWYLHSMLKNIEQITLGDISSMSAAEFDSMPFGMIRLDRAGTVKAYNQWEAQLARRNVKEVVGKNFFTEIAPCTNVAEFRGQLDELATTAGRTHIFDYDFRFPWGTRRVRVRFVIESVDERWVLVTNVPGRPQSGGTV